MPCFRKAEITISPFVLCGCDSSFFGLRERTFVIFENKMLRKYVILRRMKQVDNNNSLRSNKCYLPATRFASIIDEHKDHEVCKIAQTPPEK
jgi:hypothetical protein